LTSYYSGGISIEKGDAMKKNKVKKTRIEIPTLKEEPKK